MSHGYRHINIELHDNAVCVRLVRPRLNEPEITQLFTEILDVARSRGCVRVALAMGPDTPDCMYSVFLAKLIGLQRRLKEIGGELKLCECTKQVVGILDACVLLDRFDLVPDFQTALAQWGL
jgi:hypothetical protein